MANFKQLEVRIKNLKAVSDFSMKIEIKPGLICLVGGNGSGKSTILNTLSQLIDHKNISKLFFDEKRKDSNISISLGLEKCTWQQADGKWIKNGDFTVLKGFHESGIVYGGRFTNSSIKTIHNYCAHYTDFPESDLIGAPDFVYQNLGKILKGNENHYKGLKTLTKSFIREQARTLPKDGDHFLIKHEKPFLLMKDSGYISQYKMSSGEYLMLKILDYIYYRITYADKSPGKEPFLIIIDEVEIALHPSSQKRLIQFCNKVSKEHGICIIFSTHSRDIISNLRENQILLLESHLNSGKISITTPCYPHYAIRGIYESSGYDYIVCVEDELAKKVVTETIKKNELSKNKLVHVSALGGWREVLNFTHEFKINGLFNNTKMVIVLDGDMEEQFHKEYGSPCRACAYHNFVRDNHESVKTCGLLPPKLNCEPLNNRYPYYSDVTFLPISSIEKELRHKLITNVNYEFISVLERINYFGQTSVSELIVEYEVRAGEYFSSENFKKKNITADISNFDLDGKILWRLLTRNIKPGVAVNDLVAYLCEIFAAEEDKDIEKWEAFEKNLAILLQKPL